MESADWGIPTAIRFGVGRIGELQEVLMLTGVQRPLLVTDEGLASLPFLQRIAAQLGEAGIDAAVYSEVQGNPTLSNVEGGLAVLRREKRDGVIAIGGGSALDAGKTIAMMAGQSKPLWDYVDGEDAWMRADVRAILPVIAVPTTAGTGSEVGRAAVILDEVSHTKKIVWHPNMLPKVVISDPELTVGLPANITAWTGMDAMVHAIEAYCSPAYHPIADGIAIEAIRRVARWLPEAVGDGTNLEARGNLLVAASMGATAFQKGLGSVHSVSHVVGALYNTHHGLTNAVVLPFGLIQNLSAVRDRLSHLARVLELEDVSAGGFIDYIFSLREELSIPTSLAEIGVSAARAEEVGRLALQDPTAATNAMPLTAVDLQQLFIAAHAGKL
ncbi:MAG: iron-containing alcohol dehydrogenase [Halioglobus sp.]